MIARAGKRDDRRTRFAQVMLSDVRGGRDILLVTDSRGRLFVYRLPEGEYRLRALAGKERQFVVGNHWTTVRLSLS